MSQSKQSGDRHESSERFHQILKEMASLHDSKAKDYGSDSDPLSNVRNSEDFGIPAWVGCMVRANDKMKRLQTFAQKGELANESVIDAFNDLAVYAVIGRILYEQDYGVIPIMRGMVLRDEDYPLGERVGG